MGDAASIQRMSAAEYLAWEQSQPERYEFHQGEVFAMAGGSPRHNLLAAAIAGELRSALRGRGCATLSSDQRISAKAGERYVYADAVATCERIELEAGTTDVLANPTIVVEVLSPSTEAFDRGATWEAYQRLRSLTDYLLVSQSSARVEHYQRGDNGSWRYRVLEQGDELTLLNGARIAIAAIYEGAFELVAE